MNARSLPCDGQQGLMTDDAGEVDLPTLVDVLWRLRVRLTVVDGRLRVDAPKGVLSGSLRRALAAHRVELRRITVGAVDIDDPDEVMDVRIAAWRSRPDARRFIEAVARRQKEAGAPKSGRTGDRR